MSTEPSIGESAKNFLTKQEKNVGAAFTIACGIGGAGLLYAARGPILGFFDFGIALMGRAIMLTGLGAVAVVLVMLAMNPRTYTELWHLQRRIARWVSDRAMKADPFGRMRAFADEFLGAQYEKFNAASVRIEALLNSTRSKIETHTEALQVSNDMVKTLRARYMQPDGAWSSDQHRDQFRLESQRIKLTEEALDKNRRREIKLAALVKIVDRWRNTFKHEIESTRMSADFLEADWHAANELGGALEAASSVFGHGDMARADQEVRAYVDKITAQRIAQADVLMKQIPELTAVGDLKGDMAETEIMERLKRLDADSQRAFVEVQADKQFVVGGGAKGLADRVMASINEPVPARKYLT